MQHEQESEKQAGPSQQRNPLESRIVEVIVAMRDAYLREQGGRPPMDYWTRIEQRVRRSAAAAANMGEWVSSLQRSLQIPGLASSASSEVLELIQYCDDNEANDEALRMCERQFAKLTAIARRIIEERKQQNG